MSTICISIAVPVQYLSKTIIHVLEIGEREGKDQSVSLPTTEEQRLPLQAIVCSVECQFDRDNNQMSKWLREYHKGFEGSH